jgi:hypothetical protein
MLECRGGLGTILHSLGLRSGLSVPGGLDLVGGRRGLGQR